MKNKQLFKILTIDNELILENVSIADSFYSRFKGLMGKKNINVNQGLIIKPCNSIHTFFMKFNIDIVFIDSNNKVVDIYLNLAPRKISKIYKNAKFVIEGKAGSLVKLKKGDQIKIVKKA
jgi:hypothetical protein